MFAIRVVGDLISCNAVATATTSEPITGDGDRRCRGRVTGEGTTA